MSRFFETLLSMSLRGLIAACLVSILLVILRRTRCARTPLLLLWLVVAFRLVCPWSPPSPLSLFNFTGDEVSIIIVHSQQDTLQDTDPLSDFTPPSGQTASSPESGITSNLPGTVVTDPAETQLVQQSEASSPVSALPHITTLVWLSGMLALLVYAIFSYCLLNRRLRFAVKDEHLPDVWYSDRLSTPCVVGFLRPRIYLIFGMTEEEIRYVLTHERQHIKNGDHLWKTLGWLIMCIHWFNPLLWLCYHLFLTSLEDACDQRVLRQLGGTGKEDYGQALLSMTASRSFRPGPSPIAFGEGSTKSRIKSILRYKKPVLRVTVIAAAAAAVVGICLFTGPEKKNDFPVGEYEISDVLLLTTVSSFTRDYALSLSGNTTLSVSDSCFALNGSGIVDSVRVDDPIYLELTPEGSLPNLVDKDGHSQQDMSIPLPEGATAWEVLTAVGEETGFHLVSVGNCIWVGRWMSHGTTHRLFEYAYLIEAVPSGTHHSIAPDPEIPGETSSEVLSPPVLEDPELTWSDRVLYWSVPEAELSVGGEGFGLCFYSTAYDRLDITVDGGSLRTSKDRVYTLCVNHTTNQSAVVHWMPFFAHSSNLVENIPEESTLTFTLTKDFETVLRGQLRFTLESREDGLLTYSVRFGSDDSENFFVGLRPNDLFEVREKDANEPEDPTLTTLYADLTHDGRDETITVCGSAWDGSRWTHFYITVRSPEGKLLWYDQAAACHTGQNGIYLYEEQGRHYLLVWNNYGISGFASVMYRAFSLSRTGEELPVTEFSYSLELDDPMSVDTDLLRHAEEESLYLLSHSIILLSTNGDTPDNRYYSTPDDLLKSTFTTIWGETFTADAFDALQARAQGTYTFTAVVANILDKGIMVENPSMWADIAEYWYCLYIPVANPEQFRVDDPVRITANGPLYRWNDPDEGTSVTAELIT